MNKKATVLGLSLLVAVSSHAATIGGIALPKEHGDLELHGAGILRKGFFFNIYLGALYLQSADHASNILEDVPKRLDIHYFHNTPKKHMIRVAEKTLQKNLSDEEYKRVKADADRLHSAYLDGQKGSVASITHVPGQGLTYSVDGRHVITIQCDTFAKAYFSVWFGEKPSSETMKSRLLEKLDA